MAGGFTVAEANRILLHYFQNAALTNVGDAGGLLASATEGSLYLSLHTGDPRAGNQTTNEAAYTSYARVAVDRNSGEWTVSGNNASNAIEVQWPLATGGSETETHWGIGTASSGAGNLIFSGSLDTSRAVSSGVQPTAAIGDLDITIPTS